MKKKYQRKHSLINKTGYTPGYSTEHNPYNIIPGEDITMRNTPYPLHGTPLDENGNPMDSGLVMQPGQEYKFGGASYVAEVPMYKDGGSKESWVSHKIGILMNEGYPQKQAIAIAYSMYDQHHANGGYQLPMYQKAGIYNNGNFGGSLTYGQTPNQPVPSTTYDPNKKIDPNAPTAEGIAAYEKQQKAQDQGISIAGLGEYDTANNALGNPVSGMSNPELMPSKAQLKSNKQLNTATNNYDENGNAIDTSEEARSKAENSFGGNPLYQFANLEGDMGTDDALFHLGKNIENGSGVGIAASAATALLKGGKDFFAGMGSQRRQNNMMQSYYDKQREGMTGAGTEVAMKKYGGYYEDGGQEEEDSQGYDPNSARDTWEAKTGMPWAEANRLGYTNNSAKDNTKLLSELQDSRFNKNNLRKEPIKASTPQLNKAKSSTWYKEGVYKKAYEESDFKDDIDRNKQPYPEDADIVETKRPAAKTPAKKPVSKPPVKKYTQEELEAVWGKAPVNPIDKYISNMGTTPGTPKQKASTPQLKKQAAKTTTKPPTQEELDAVWGKSRIPNMANDFVNPDKRHLQSGVITDKGQNMSYVIQDGKVIKSMPVLTGMNRNLNKNDYTMEQLDANPEYRNTPTGTYFMNPDPNIYGEKGFDLAPIPAFGKKAPIAKNTAIHTLYGTNPNKGEEGYEPAEGRRRMKAINSSNPNDRYKSYGCTNCKKPDINYLTDRFQKGDTAIYVDSKRGDDAMFLKRMGIKQDGGYYQEGGMQPGMEEGMEGQMSNPQEEGMEQQGGGQEQQIMQEVAQALQQGADPQQIIQQLVQMGIPQEQAAQMVQMVMQQVQGGQQQPQQQGTPQLKRGGYYQEGGEAMDEQREGENEGAEGETANLEQIESQVEQALKQGADPQQVLQQLIKMGIPQEQAVQMVQEILQEIQGGETGMEAPEQGTPQMRDGGNYLNTLKGKTIKDYTYNSKTNSYTVSYE
jgi:hypothetical protein